MGEGTDLFSRSLKANPSLSGLRNFQNGTD